MSTDVSRLVADANVAADQAVEGAKLAAEFAQDARRDRKRVEELTPNAERDVIRELAAREGGAMLRLGPRRSMWRDLEAFEAQLVEIEMRRDELTREIGSLSADINNEPERYANELADYIGNGSQGHRPEKRTEALVQKLDDCQAEYAALGVRYDRLLRERAEHIGKRRKPMVADVAKAKAEVMSKALAAVDQLEALRQELLDLRSSEVFLTLFPDEVLASAPPTTTIVGALPGLQKAHLPDVNTPLVARAVFDLLRADLRFCESVATEAQAAKEQGVSLGKLTGKVADWLHGKADYVAPDFGSAWGGSPEERQIAERVAAYTEAQRRRVQGDV